MQPVYYCTFTVFSIVGGALIYDELGGISVAQAIMFGCGILAAFAGVAILMSGRESELPTSPKHGGSSKKLPLTEEAKALPMPASANDDGSRPARPSGTGSGASKLQNAGSGTKVSPPKTRVALKPMPLSPGSLRLGKMNTVEVHMTFRDLGNAEKLDAMERQLSSSSLLCGGIASSLVQASSESVVASDKDAALLLVQAANYPGSLSEARRLQRRGRLDEGEGGFFASLGAKIFAAMSMAPSASQRNKVGDSTDVAQASAADPELTSAAEVELAISQA